MPLGSIGMKPSMSGNRLREIMPLVLIVERGAAGSDRSRNKMSSNRKKCICRVATAATIRLMSKSSS